MPPVHLLQWIILCSIWNNVWVECTERVSLHICHVRAVWLAASARFFVLFFHFLESTPTLRFLLLFSYASCSFFHIWIVLGVLLLGFLSYLDCLGRSPPWFSFLSFFPFFCSWITLWLCVCVTTRPSKKEIDHLLFVASLPSILLLSHNWVS